MSDDFLDTLIKIRIKRNDADHDNYRKNGGLLTPYSVISSSHSASMEASSSSLNVVERVPRLLFLLPANISPKRLSTSPIDNVCD